MTCSAFGAIFRNELRLLKRDTAVVVLILAMPLVVTSILKSTMASSLQASGVQGANGAEQVVPGIALLFSFFLVAFISFSFFREHGWGTWDRLRASRATRFDIMAAKALPWAIVSLAQLTILFAAGVVLFDLKIHSASAVGAMALLGVVWTIFLLCFALAITAIASSIQVVQAVGNLGSIVFGTLGGALVPMDQLPGWARSASPFIPTHWAMKGFNAVLIEDDGLMGVLTPVLVILGISAVFGTIAFKRFDFETVKTSFA